jgi:hypothetical protein
MVFSGAILHSLGTTYTGDIDIMYYGEGETQEEIQQIKTLLDSNSSYDYSIIYNKTVITKGETRNYLYNWLFIGWPNLVNKPNMLEIMADPEFHYYFMGIKMVSVKMIIERLLRRAAPTAFVDLLMLKKINGYDSSPCFPNMSLRKGKITIYTDDEIDRKLHTVKYYFKNWHHIDISMDKLRLLVPRCNESQLEKFNITPEHNPYTDAILKCMDRVIKHYVTTYLQGDKLLEIGNTFDVDFYRTNNIKEVINIGVTDLKDAPECNEEEKVKICRINDPGYDSWTHNGRTFQNVFADKPYKSILFNFSIHYLIQDVKNLLKNISSVDTENTTIVVAFLDGNKVNRKLSQNNGKYEIILGDEPLYGVYSLRGSKSLAFKDVEYIKNIKMIYFKGVYGVDSGAIEFIVDSNYLIQKLGSIGYHVINEANFNQVGSVVDMNDAQKGVLELYKIMVFKKGQIGESQYTKYKQKYLALKKY